MSKDRFTRRVLGRALVFTPLAAAGVAPTACAPNTAPVPTDLDRAALEALAQALLPSELPEAERRAAVADFVRWLDEYTPDAEMDHGYGFTQLRYTAPDPLPGYAADLEAMRASARERFGVELAALAPDQLRSLAAEAIEAAAPELENIPGRPQAPHLCVALLAAYYGSPAATDRAYGSKIQRETCRGLFVDVDAVPDLLPPLQTGDPEE
jgi:hypothetical protein